MTLYKLELIFQIKNSNPILCLQHSFMKYMHIYHFSSIYVFDYGLEKNIIIKK